MIPSANTGKAFDKSHRFLIKNIQHTRNKNNYVQIQKHTTYEKPVANVTLGAWISQGSLEAQS